MRVTFAFAAAALFIAAAATCAAAADELDRFEQQFAKHQAALSRRWGNGTNRALAATLSAMEVRDQRIRQQALRTQTRPGNKPGAMLRDMRAADARNSALLRSIVDRYGWPTIALVGLKPSRAAALILNHTQDERLRSRLLPQLFALARAGRIEQSDVALIDDKSLLHRHQSQYFGSQFKMVNGRPVLYPVSDPAGLEKRRAQFYLPPESAYLQLIRSMYAAPVH